MLFIGVDPGISGAWALIDENCKILEAQLFKDSGLCSVYTGTGAVAVIEKVHAMPRQGVSSTFTFAENYGMWQGCFKARCIPYSLVTPQKWQKEILDFQIGKEEKPAVETPQEAGARAARNRAKLKAGITNFVKRQMPDSVEYLKRKCDQDIADALCLALYARKIYLGM